MNNKFWILIAAIVGVAILAMGWFLGVSPKLDEVTAANEQRASVEVQNKAHQAKLDALEKQNEQIDDLKTQLADAQVSLPPGDELSTFLGQLHQLEGVSGVVLNSFQASQGAPFIPAGSSDGGETSSLVTAQNFIVVTIDLKVTGTRDQVLNFVDALQKGERLFLVNSLTVQSGSDTEEGYSGTISGFVYVLVDPSAPPPTPTPVGALDTKPSPSATPAP